MFALVPAKDPLRSKSRLASLMPSSERLEFNLALRHRTLECCINAFGAARTVLVSPDRSLLDEARGIGVNVVEEPLEIGLNRALILAAEHALQLGAEGTFIVPTDIGDLSESALLSALKCLPTAPGCLIVGDRERNGTNLLGIRPFRHELIAFGEGSYARHIRCARQLDYRVREHADPTLELDIDYPEDYWFWCRQRAIGRSDFHRDGKYRELI